MDSDDTAEMIAEYKKTCYETFPRIDPLLLTAPAGYSDYINCDINGSSRPDPKNSGLMNEPAVVTWKDVEVLSQFIPLRMGDFDWDGDVLDDDDWAAFNAAFGSTREDVGGTGAWSWFDGDVTGDGLVDAADLFILDKIGQSIDGDLDLNGFVNSDDLNIVRANWGSTVAPGDLSLGDANGDGTVNSDDLNIVRANWGRIAGSTVPEPGAAVLLAMVFPCRLSSPSISSPSISSPLNTRASGQISTNQITVYLGAFVWPDPGPSGHAPLRWQPPPLPSVALPLYDIRRGRKLKTTQKPHSQNQNSARFRNGRGSEALSPCGTD